jgi:hypothetical protein
MKRDKFMQLLDSLSQDEIKDLIREAEHSHRASTLLAREDFNEFAERVLVNETTGERILQQWFHEDWARRREEHNRALFISAVGLGKSKQFSVAYPVWLLGRNPRLRIAIVSKTISVAKQLTNECAKLIEESPDVHEIFPDLKPGHLWNEGERVVQRPLGVRDPSLKPIGLGSGIMGMRFDVVILDDVLDLENSRIQSRRDQTEAWINATLFSRLEPDRPGRDPTKVFFVGNTWNPDDVYERFAEGRDAAPWPVFRYPVIANEKLKKQCPQAFVPESQGGPGITVGSSIWPARYTNESLAELQENTPHTEWMRAYMCESKDDSDAHIPREWLKSACNRGLENEFEVCQSTKDFLLWDDESLELDDDAEEQDEFLKDLANFRNPDSDFWFISGVDISTGESSDLSAITTIAVCKESFKRFVLSVRSGLWKAPELVRQVKKAYADYGSVFMVENNGQQGWLRQMLERDTTIPIYKYNTGWTKADPKKGFPSIAFELEKGRWVFPMSPHPIKDIPHREVREGYQEIELLCDELAKYDPRGHTGDRAMSMWFAQIMATMLERRELKRQAKASRRR